MRALSETVKQQQEIINMLRGRQDNRQARENVGPQHHDATAACLHCFFHHACLCKRFHAKFCLQVNADLKPVAGLITASAPAQTVCPGPDHSEAMAKGIKRQRAPTPDGVPQLSDEDEAPRVLDAKNLSRNEKQKLRRIVMPKQGSGNLEVPENIMQMWEEAGSKRDALFSTWAKSGGVKASECSKFQ